VAAVRQEIDTMGLRVAMTGIAGAVIWPLLWLLLLLLVAPGYTGGEETTGEEPRTTISQHSADLGCSTVSGDGVDLLTSLRGL